VGTVRAVYLVAGLTLAGVGIVGIVTPLLPGTIFLVLSLFCFKRSSPRLENWLLNHPRCGPTLRDWEEQGAIKARTKLIAISAMWLCVLVSLFLLRDLWLGFVVGALAVFGTWYIASRPSVACPESRVPSHKS
jgi:uncharacterized membrane protein YbaN (DUF454 family)